MSANQNFSLMVHGGAGALDNVKDQKTAVRYLDAVRGVLEHVELLERVEQVIAQRHRAVVAHQHGVRAAHDLADRLGQLTRIDFLLIDAIASLATDGLDAIGGTFEVFCHLDH